LLPHYSLVCLQGHVLRHYCLVVRTRQGQITACCPCAAHSHYQLRIHTHTCDLVRPLPVSSGGFNYIFTMIDRSTRWLEAVLLKDVSATSSADNFVATWVSRSSVPECITSDSGLQFTSAVWSILCARLGISHSLTTAFHPQSDGMVERARRQLKNALPARVAGHDWPTHLPWVLLGLRAAPKEDSNISSAEFCFGAALTLPGEFIAVPEPPRKSSLILAGGPSSLNQAQILYPGC
jgi:hypothetical protein